jgi:hypothetical protein
MSHEMRNKERDRRSKSIPVFGKDCEYLCNFCDGSGELHETNEIGDITYKIIECAICEGTGYINTKNYASKYKTVQFKSKLRYRK